jgi:hypothetical protein
MGWLTFVDGRNASSAIEAVARILTCDGKPTLSRLLPHAHSDHKHRRGCDAQLLSPSVIPYNCAGLLVAKSSEAVHGRFHADRSTIGMGRLPVSWSDD